MTDKCTCTKFGAALLFAVGAALLMPPETLAQTAARKPGTTVARKGAPAGARATRAQRSQPTIINNRQRGQIAPIGGGIAGGSNCCVAHPTPGCDDPKCEALICGADAFCCDVQWDGICANAALGQCAVCTAGGPCEGAPPPANDTCSTATNGGIIPEGGSVVFTGSNCGATPDCAEVSGAGQGNVWLQFEILEAAPVTLSYCGSDGVWGNAWLILTNNVSPCAGSSNDCCVPSPNGTPGCSDPACCELICAQDPFCCQVLWDGLCSGAALSQCAVCAGQGPCVSSTNDCCAPSPNGTPGCNDPTCCEQICAADPFCCNTAWDTLCADAAVAGCAICGGGGDPCTTSTNDCCVPSPNGTVGCSDPTCCSQICAADPFCCETAWDSLCADAAVAGCAVCSGGGDPCTTSTNNCCAPSPNGTPGCSDPTCCSQICAADPFCCDTSWDTLCANAAIANCAVCGGGGAGTEECCQGTSPIATFAFSCPDGNVQMTWSSLPAGVWYYPVMLDPAFGSQGDYVVTIGVLGPPANDDCEDRIEIGEVCQMPFSTLGATTDGPPHVACEDGFADQQVNQDIWYNYTPTCTGDVSVSLCGSGYDTKLAVYDGCTCPVGDANLIDCEDDTCGLQSQITFAATAGTCYKIRVGGFGGAFGSGVLTINNSGVPCTGDCPSDVNGNGVTNVDDLLIVINGWGPCPP